MSGRPKEFDLSLMQRDPAREQMLSKMRGKLASAPPVPPEGPAQASGRVKRGSGWTWTVRVAMVALIAAINWLLIDRKDVILSTIGMQGIPSLPKASLTYTPDEKALYYTYALFDYRKFQERFGTNEYYAINPADARKRLEELLPRVSTATLGEISGYTPVAFKSVSAGGLR
jgi:hypothetical protein